MDSVLTLTLVGDDPVGLTEDLLEWLRDEPELMGAIRAVTRPPEPGHMGAVAEIVVASVSTGGVVSVLVASLASWLNRNRAVSLRLRRGEDELEISANSVSEARQLLEGVQEALEPDR